MIFYPYSLLLALLCCLAAQVAAQHEESGGFEALLFYYGYLREWTVRKGDTSIGGNACRGFRQCSFKDFMSATTMPGGQGGFDGSAVRVLGSLVSTYSHSRTLTRAGLLTKIEWDPKRLVIGAPDGMDVYTDYVHYVLNTATEDGIPDSLSDSDKRQVEMLDTQMAEALNLMSQVNAVYAAEEHADWWRENLGGGATRYSWVDAKDVYTAWQDSPRQVFDVVNLVRTWAYEVPPDFMEWKKYLTYKNPQNPQAGRWPHVGYRMQLAKSRFKACRRGPQRGPVS